MSIGCTSFRFGTTAHRAMDYPVDMQSQILIFNQGQQNTTTSFDGKPGLSWTNKYGYIGINAFGLNMIDAGLNNQGLCCDYLSLPETIYPTPLPAFDPKSLPVSQMAKWILGNFKTVDEVKNNLESVWIWGDEIPQIKQVPLIHISIHDKTGKSGVIEFKKGRVKFYENKIGVVTNEPTFRRHLDLVRQFGNVSNTNPPNSTINGYQINNYQETGMVGLPGDWSSSSRFVRIAKILQFSTPGSDPVSNIFQGAHILDSVYIQPGTANVQFNNQTCPLSTQWTTSCDLANNIFYWRSSDLVFRSIDLNAVDFSPEAQHQPIPVKPPTPVIIPVKV